ncbi:MAG: hypothetical protein ACRCSP_09785 [Rhodoglobus sp.]
MEDLLAAYPGGLIQKNVGDPGDLYDVYVASAPSGVLVFELVKKNENNEKDPRYVDQMDTVIAIWTTPGLQQPGDKSGVGSLFRSDSPLGETCQTGL